MLKEEAVAEAQAIKKDLSGCWWLLDMLGATLFLCIAVTSMLKVGELPKYKCENCVAMYVPNQQSEHYCNYVKNLEIAYKRECWEAPPTPAFWFFLTIVCICMSFLFVLKHLKP